MADDASQSADHNSVQVFEGRLILQARPPITADELTVIQARCAGPIPPDLERLWRLTFGGQIDYGLSVEFDGLVHEFSFTELFYPGSNHYHDLDGWIGHELELGEKAAAEAGRPWSGKLSFLPFGGFEYLERLYVCVAEGADYGAVLAFAQGLPPAWILNLHQDSVARIADDLPSLFRMLDLPDDPRSLSEDDFGPGIELLSAIQAIDEVDSVRASKLERLIEEAVVDWRGSLMRGDIVFRPRERRLAFLHACKAGDIAVLDRLRSLGCDLNEPVQGGGSPLQHALAVGQADASRWLIDHGGIATDAIASAARTAPPQLIEELLARGARPSALGAAAAARAGHMESARLIADALSRSDPSAIRELVDDLASWAGGAEATARRIEAGSLASNKTSVDYQYEGGRMRALRDHCQSLLRPAPQEPRPKPIWQRFFRS